MDRTPDRTPMVIRNIPDAIAAIPYLLGFHPVDSLVVIGYDGPHNTCAVRIDLPSDDPTEAAERIAVMLADNDFRRALIVGYGPEDRVLRAATITAESLSAHGLALADAARASDGQWWSLTSETEGCGLSGRPYDISSSLVAAQATYSGHVALADRSELTRTVAPLAGPARTTMQKATLRVEQQLKSWEETLPPAQYRRRIIEKGLTLLSTLRNYATHQPTEPQTHPSKSDNTTKSTRKPTDEEVAWLGWALVNLRVRDEAWVRINEEDPEEDIHFWRDILCRVDPEFANAPASLLAYAAYVSGDGGLANVALDRTTPNYSMAALLHSVIEAGVPPSEVRIRMTPEELAASYQEDPWPP